MDVRDVVMEAGDAVSLPEDESDGVYIGVALVALFNVIDQYYFIYFVMLVFFVQSIGSSIYLAVIRRT